MGTEAERAKTKVCFTCETDVSQLPRIKDKYGNYFCERCWNRENAEQTTTEASELDELLDCPMCGGSYPIGAMAMSGVCKRCASRPPTPTLVRLVPQSEASALNIRRFFLIAFVVAGLSTAVWMLVAFNPPAGSKLVVKNSAATDTSGSEIAQSTEPSKTDSDPLTELYRQLKLWKETSEWHPWLYPERSTLSDMKVTAPVTADVDGKSTTTIEACIWVSVGGGRIVPKHMHYVWASDQQWKVSGTVVDDPDPEYGYLGIQSPKNFAVDLKARQEVESDLKRLEQERAKSRNDTYDRVVESFCNKYPDMRDDVHSHDSYHRQRVALQLQQMVSLGEVDITVARRVQNYMSSR